MLVTNKESFMRLPFVKICLFLLLTLGGGLLMAADAEQGSNWPREIEIKEGVVVLYQPQPEKLEGNILKGRAAVSVEMTSRDQPVFGAIWFSAELRIDRSDRTAYMVDLDVDNIRIPEEDQDKAGALAALLEREIPKMNIPISMDNLLATLEVVDARASAAEQINTKPPKIVFSTEPAVLIPLDGKPQIREIEGSSIRRVINTPFTLLQDPASDTFYLYADEDTWYRAEDLQGSWQITSAVPASVAKLAPPAADSEPEEEAGSGAPPKVIVSTEPTELIVIDGKPEFSPVEGTQLLYVSNTESDLLMDINGQNYYVLLAGRWYTTRDLDGPWSYTAGEDLPTDFKAIPESSEVNTVLYAVPGTKAAEEAVLDAQMPQTAAVDPSKASLSVEYDGAPSFKDLDGTSLDYAVNTATPVILVDGRYYAVDEAIWFVADNPNGSWAVAREVPAEIYSIPPESPLYYVTFVRIYKAEPDVVYVGYTPGYTNTYIYNTTVVYGTGYYYPGWYGRYYYPRYSTWGFHVRYTPWGGWRFGFSYSSGPFHFYVGGGGWYRGGWWGPVPYRGYHRGYRHGYNHGYRNGFNHGYAAGYVAGRHRDVDNLYRSRKNVVRTQPATAALADRSRGRVASTRANNVYTDRDGNIYRDRGNDGWDKRTKDGWKKDDIQRPATQPDRPVTKPESRPQQLPEQRPQQRPESRPASRPSTQPSHSRDYSNDLNRSRDMRARGNQRTSSYNRARSGGGMRRR
jgi:hypothetical protein